jgi:hypothetical protein
VAQKSKKPRFIKGPLSFFDMRAMNPCENCGIGLVLSNSIPLCKECISTLFCETPYCRNCGVNEANDGERFLVCGGCKVVRYCSITCQHTHWKDVHAKVCKVFQKMPDNERFIMLKAPSALKIATLFPILKKATMEMLAAPANVLERRGVVVLKAQNRHFESLFLIPEDRLNGELSSMWALMPPARRDTLFADIKSYDPTKRFILVLVFTETELAGVEYVGQVQHWWKK